MSWIKTRIEQAQWDRQELVQAKDDWRRWDEWNALSEEEREAARFEVRCETADIYQPGGDTAWDGPEDPSFYYRRIRFVPPAWLIALTFDIAPLVCRLRGHDERVQDMGGPESGMGPLYVRCVRCGSEL